MVRVFAFCNDRLDNGATPIETTVAALCSLAELHDRVTRNVIYAVF